MGTVVMLQMSRASYAQGHQHTLEHEKCKNLHLNGHVLSRSRLAGVICSKENSAQTGCHRAMILYHCSHHRVSLNRYLPSRCRLASFFDSPRHGAKTWCNRARILHHCLHHKVCLHGHTLPCFMLGHYRERREDRAPHEQAPS